LNKGKAENVYLKKINAIEKGIYKASTNAVMEGFEYFGCTEYMSKHGAVKETPISKIMSMKGLDKFRVAGIMGKHGKTMFGSIKQSFNDVESYIDELNRTNEIKIENNLMDTYPNSRMWEMIKKEAWDRWRMVIGFTKVSRDLIFKGKGTLFEHAIICIQEMDKTKIDEAPSLTAGSEVIRVYKTLGVAVNEMAQWLREEFNIKCQSNHPLGGLVDTCPLAVQAGLGFQGCNGLVITPQFGQRQRIAPIFIQQKLFEYTDSKEHSWGEKFCQKCGRCRKSCPAGAINEHKKIRTSNVGTIGDIKQCIDREKCFPYFSKTLGCSVCLKVCPFSKGNGAYYKIKSVYLKEERFDGSVKNHSKD